MPQQTQPNLILASASPRRLDLLAQIGVVPDRVAPAHIDESPLTGEMPAQYALRMAREKAEAAFNSEFATLGPADLVLAADTVVACGRRILPKAESEDQAKHCLALLSGRAHRVYSAVVVRNADRSSERNVMTRVRFARLSSSDIQTYLEGGEWQGKAGGYAIQGHAAAFVAAINGSYSAVVGLPLFETYRLLVGLGYRPATTVKADPK